MELVLIRHAISYHSQQGIIADMMACRGLTHEGYWQLERLVSRLKATHELDRCAVVLTSPVLRAQQSAAVLASTPNCQIVPDADLREISPGAAEGLRWPDYHQRYGPIDLVAEPDRPFSPGGESWNMFLARVQRTLDRLATYAGQHVVAVTHAGFIVAALLAVFAIPRPGTKARFEPEYLSLTHFSVRAGIWQLARFNDAVHLHTLFHPERAV